MFLMSIATMLTTVPSKENETVSRIHINRRPKDLAAVQYMELFLFSSLQCRVLSIGKCGNIYDKNEE